MVGDPDNTNAEFAITVRSDLKSQGLGTLLVTRLIDYCRQRGTECIVGEALSDNSGLRRLVHRFGFDILPSGDPGVRALRLDLRKDAGATIEPVHPQHLE